MSEGKWCWITVRKVLLASVESHVVVQSTWWGRDFHLLATLKLHRKVKGPCPRLYFKALHLVPTPPILFNDAMC